MFKSIDEYRLTEEELGRLEKESIKEKNYRYILKRTWNKNLPKLTWIMLNPSIADDNINDPTVSRCMGYGKGLGYGSIYVVNLFAYIATDPKNLHNIISSKGINYAIGEKNNEYIIKAVEESNLVICAWGNNAERYKRHMWILEEFKDYNLKALKLNKSGHPSHPLDRRLGYLDIQKESDLVGINK